MIRTAFTLLLCILASNISGQIDTLVYGEAYVYVHSSSQGELVGELEGNFDYNGYGPNGDISLGSIIFQSLQVVRPELSDSVVIELFSKENQDGIPDYESRNYFDFESKSIISLEDINRSGFENDDKVVGLESFYQNHKSKIVDCKVLVKQEKIFEYLIKNEGLKNAYIHSESPLIVRFENETAAELLIVPTHMDDTCQLGIYSTKSY